MISLLIDTCTSTLNLGLFNDTTVIDSIIREGERDLSSNLIPIIDQLLKTNNLSIENIDNIFVAIGPGSFTGIRIGVTCAKVIAWTLNKRVIPFSSLELLATTKSDSDLIVPLIDARRGYVFAGVYDKNLNNLLDDNYIKLEELISKLDDNKRIDFISLDDFEIKTNKPNIDMKKIIKKHFNDSSINPHQLNPNYLKRTEAEENLGN